MRAVARALALFLGGFTLLNLGGEALHPGFDANVWWIDLRPLPPAAAALVLIPAAAALLAWAFRPASGRRRKHFTAAAAAVLLAVATVNGLRFYTHLGAGEIRSDFPFPLSFLIAAALGLILGNIDRWNLEPGPSHRGRGHWIGVTTLAACLAGFPLAQIFCFGKTDYRRPADAVVVFGARVYADGGLSQAVADRVRTGCRLYRDGLVGKVVFSGGPGDGAVHETEGMRRAAIALGVPAEDILLDPGGVNTQSTVRNTAAILRADGVRRTLAVSHFYHLPRIKLAYQREGIEVYTVPAEETRLLTKMPFFIGREVVSLWA